MTQKLYAPEQVAEYLGVTLHKVATLLRSKQLGCVHIGQTKRVTEVHIDEYLKLAASRPPRKRRPRPQIPTDLSPVWKQLFDAALSNQPLLAAFMTHAALLRIDTQTRTAFITAATAETAAVLMAEPNRYALQRGLKTSFKRPLKINVTCS